MRFSGTYTNRASNTFFSNTGGSAGSAAATWVINAGNLDNTASGNPTISLGSLSGTGGNLGNNVANTSVTYFIGALNTSTTFAGTISGSTTGLVKVGSGTLTLGAANSFTGGTTINNGTLQLNVGGQNGTLTGAAVVINNGGTLLGQCHRCPGLWHPGRKRCDHQQRRRFQRDRRPPRDAPERRHHDWRHAHLVHGRRRRQRQLPGRWSTQCHLRCQR